ncbi:MAG: cupin domain-containing protein [Thermoleophilaceae bacterium]|nr:cupin domain-containing protein [Thermoleophilaceae bacterium]
MSLPASWRNRRAVRVTASRRRVARSVSVAVSRVIISLGNYLSKPSLATRHKTQEELYLVASGTLTFKLGDDVLEVGPGTAVRVAPATARGIHNDSDADAILVIASTKIDDVRSDTEMVEGFWPAD